MRKFSGKTFYSTKISGIKIWQVLRCKSKPTQPALPWLEMFSNFYKLTSHPWSMMDMDHFQCKFHWQCQKRENDVCDMLFYFVHQCIMSFQMLYTFSTIIFVIWNLSENNNIIIIKLKNWHINLSQPNAKFMSKFGISIKIWH